MILWVILAAFAICIFFRFPYLYQDVKFIVRNLRIRRRVFHNIQNNYTIVDCFLERVNKQPNKPLLLFKDETFTYQDADRLSNQAARALLQNGLLKQGDTVTFFVTNEPMFVWLLLAVFKIGCSVALLNTNIRSKSLLHCFKCSGAQVLLVTEGEMSTKTKSVHVYPSAALLQGQ